MTKRVYIMSWNFLYGTERIDKRLAKSQDLSLKYSFMSRNIYCSYLHIYIVRTMSLGVWFIFIQKMIYHNMILKHKIYHARM